MGAGGFSHQTRDFNIGALPALGAAPAKTDMLASADASDSNKVKSITAENILQTPSDASVSEQTVPAGNDRIAILDSAASYALKYLKWSTVSTLGSGPTAAALNVTGRLSAYSNNPRPIFLAKAATSIYFVPDEDGCGSIRLYNGSSWDSYAFNSQVTLSLSGVTAGFYDVFLYQSSGTLTLELSTVWTNTYQKRANAVVLQDGVPVKSGTTSRRLVGFIYVYATGLVNQSSNPAENGLVSVQDMFDPEYEHSWYGEHTGWTIPWAVCAMVRNAQMRGSAPNLEMRNEGSSFAPTLPAGGMGWCFRRPYMLHYTQTNTNTQCMMSCGFSDSYRFATSYSGSTNPMSSYTAAPGGQPRRMAYDPVGDKFYVGGTAASQVYKFDPSARTFTAPAGLNKSFLSGWKASGDMCLSQRKIFASDGSNMYALDPSADTFGSAGEAITTGNGYRVAWSPIADRLYVGTTSQTVKVIDPSTGTLTTTITLTANNYFAGGAVTDCVYCPSTKCVYVFGYANGDGSIDFGRCVVINTDHSINRVIQIAKGFRSIFADYIPGWDSFVINGVTNTSFGTNDSTRSSLCTLSPHAISLVPTTTFATATVNQVGCGNLWEQKYILGATPTPGYLYISGSGGMWCPMNNAYMMLQGINNSGTNVYPMWFFAV